MKKTAFRILWALIASLFAGCAPKADGERTLRVLSWNVWHAGHSKAFPEAGCRAVHEILKQSEADVVIMVETYGSAPAVAEALGYEYHLVSDNLCIYSRYPIVEHYAFPDSISTFNFGGVRLDVDGSPVRLFATWLHYLPDARLAPTDRPESEIIAWERSGSRHREICTILSVLEPLTAQCDSIPIILGGDFNTHSHLDWTDATRNLYNHGGAVVAWPVSKELERRGWSDSFREIHPDPAAAPGTTWLAEADEAATESRSDRIDFIYYRGRTIRAVASECFDCNLGKRFRFRGGEFLYPSDHGFVLTDFRIGAAAGSDRGAAH